MCFAPVCFAYSQFTLFTLDDISSILGEFNVGDNPEIFAVSTPGGARGGIVALASRLSFLLSCADICGSLLLLLMRLAVLRGPLLLLLLTSSASIASNRSLCPARSPTCSPWPTPSSAAIDVTSRACAPSAGSGWS